MLGIPGMVTDAQAHVKRVALATPSLGLLQGLLAIKNKKRNTVDLVKCYKIACDPSVDKETSLLMSNVIDASRYSVLSSVRYVKFKDLNFNDIITSQTMPELHSSVMNMSFYAASSETKNAMTHLFNKCGPIPCQLRMFPDVASGYLDESIVAKLEKSLKSIKLTKKGKKKMEEKIKLRLRKVRLTNQNIRQILLCSLLGNYEHCDPVTRPGSFA